MDTDVQRRDLRVPSDGIERLAGEGDGIVGTTEGEHQPVADLLDELALVFERQRPDRALQPRQRLHRKLVALGVR